MPTVHKILQSINVTNMHALYSKHTAATTNKLNAANSKHTAHVRELTETAHMNPCLLANRHYGLLAIISTLPNPSPTITV